MHHPQKNANEQNQAEQAHQVSGQKKTAGSHMQQQVKLQQMQDEFLKWLDSVENSNTDLDQYAYKKVR